MNDMAVLEMKYFVLKPKAKSKDDIYAAASQNAMCAYADVIRTENPQLARELDNWSAKEAAVQVRGNWGRQL